jgi:hypothetical protein
MPKMLHLYFFRYIDPLSDKWIRSRYRATKEEIARRYEQFEIIEPPEMREISDNPLANSGAHLMRGGNIKSQDDR